MDVKYSKGSKTLADLKNQLEKEYEQEVACRVRNEKARMKKEGFFTNAQEMIDWVLSGKRIVAADDPNEFFQLCDVLLNQNSCRSYFLMSCMNQNHIWRLR